METASGVCLNLGYRDLNLRVRNRLFEGNSIELRVKRRRRKFASQGQKKRGCSRLAWEQHANLPT